MNENKLYTSGQFAKMANISVRTIRYYDQQNILKPTSLSPSGSRFYTDEDFVRLQQILLLKYLGFSLDDIREMTIDDADKQMMINALNIQLKLVRDKIEQMQMVEKAILNTTSMMSKSDGFVSSTTDWSHMLDLIYLTNMETSLKSQYQTASNISARIQLHNLYSTNKQGWFPWIYEQCHIHSHMRILEIGCGSGTFWMENIDRIPDNVSIILSDVSEGMIRETRRDFEPYQSEFKQRNINITFQAFDCAVLPFASEEFDLIIANHVLFYCSDITQAIKEIKRALNINGTFICSTYSDQHMKEISRLVREFDDRITLSADRLYENFGLDNGTSKLIKQFNSVEKRIYDDSLLVTNAQPLIEYILSCHGNQKQYLLERYKDFREFITAKVKKSYHITKEAGIFLCK